MRNKIQNSQRIKMLWIDLITTILMMIAVIAIIVIASISIKNMNKQNSLLSEHNYVESVETTLNGETNLCQKDLLKIQL